MNATFDWSNRTIDIIFYTIGACELLLIIAACILNGFFLYIFIKAPLFHENLIRLVKCIYLASIVFTLARIIIIFGRLSGLDTGGKGLIRDWGGGSGNAPPS